MDLSGITSAILILPGIPVLLAPQSLLWVFILGAITAFVVAYGIGANDVANAFGTSVGSGAISLFWALILASIMEFSGAIALGHAVTQTIRSSIANEGCFAGDQSELMLGMMCSLFSSGVWLLIASALGLPVSTTHSTVGGIIGFTIASQGWDCVKWGIDGFSGIVLSWFVSPVVAGFFASIIYVSSVKFIVKADEPMDRGFKAIPILLCVSLVTVLSLIFFKSPATKNVEDWVSYLVVGIAGVASLAGGYFLGKPVMCKLIEWRNYWRTTHFTSLLGDNKKVEYTDVDKDITVALDEDGSGVSESQKIPKVDEINDHGRTQKESEVDDIFSFFQVFTACFQSFAHGANDVANAVGPFVTIWFLWQTGESGSEQTPFWILAAGGFGIVLGLATFGKSVMETIGKRITHVNFCRGFSVELSATFAVVFASRLGFPISTTHCGVGAVVAVGIMNKLLRRWDLLPVADLERVEKESVSWTTFRNIAISWLVTVPVSAFGSAGLFGLFVRQLVSEWKEFPGNSTTNGTYSF